MRRNPPHHSPDAIKIQSYINDFGIKPLNNRSNGNVTTDKMPAIEHKSQKAEESDPRHKHRGIVEYFRSLSELGRKFDSGDGLSKSIDSKKIGNCNGLSPSIDKKKTNFQTRLHRL
jgi:hypothetical protein